jgi:sulfur carrier protein
MKILINGESRELTESLNLREFLQHFSLPAERIAIELNKEVIRRKDWESVTVKDADQIEIVHFVGGG